MRTMSALLRVSVPALLLASLGQPVPAQLGFSKTDTPDPANVLLIVADDLGVDMIGAYGEGTNPPPTPNIDALASNGVLFRNAYSNPAGSVTLATIETGRYAQRTGVGYVIYQGDQPLPRSEIILPEMLDLGTGGAYAHALIGKWFLGNEKNGGNLSPNLMGYGHYEGIIAQLYLGGYDYFQHELVTNGVVSLSDTYATTEQVDSALDWIAGAPEPWYCQLAFNAPHTPIHEPPANLFTVPVPPVLEPHGDLTPFYMAMIEALDTELGRLMASVDPKVLARTTVIFLGDNGTPGETVLPPFVPGHGKLTVYEGGVNVPLIVSGAQVVSPGREETALVNTVDLFSTIADLASVDLDDVMPPGAQLDAVSLYPYLRDPGVRDLRDTVFSEMFTPNGVTGPYEAQIYAIRDERYKIVRQSFGLGSPSYDEFYDLQLDPFEQSNLLAGRVPPTAEAARAYFRLDQELDRLPQLP